MIDKLFGLEGKVAVVIGGAGHLCSTLARAMAECGMKVDILDVAKPSSLEGAQGIGFVRCDVLKRNDLLKARRETLKRHRRIDVLLNGAGTNAPTPFFKVTEREFDRIVGVNLLGTLLACQIFGEVMVKQCAGSIINFASVSMGPPLSKAFAYSTAKAGVANLTQNLGREWGRFGVRVNALRPGFFPTAWSMKHFIDRQRKAKILSHTPMGRFGKPQELTGAVLWLASDASSFVTGSIVTVDGGFTAMTI